MDFKHAIFISILFLVGFNLKAQTLELYFDFDEHLLIEDIHIYKDGTLFTKTQKHLIYLPIQQKETLFIKNEMFEDFILKINEKLSYHDTIHRFITLKSKTQNYEVVTISASKYSEVPREKNEFIYDYYPILNGKLLTLSRKKSHKKGSLKLISGINEEKLQELNFNFTPEKLFYDALQNFYILSKDSAYSISFYLDKIKLETPMSISEFDDYFRHLTKIQRDTAFYSIYTERNKHFNLMKLYGQNAPQLLYESFDWEKYDLANYFYNRAIAIYFAKTPDYMNQILLGIWDGNLNSLSGPAITLEFLWISNFYEKKLLNNLNVSAFGMRNKIVVFDGISNEIIKIDYFSDNKNDTIKCNYDLTDNYFYDNFYDNLYMIDDAKGTTQVYKIDIATGQSKLIADLSDLRKPKNIKVINDKVYFLILEENRYYQLVKVN